jgi:SAM-dependent methyltransferase
VDVSKPLLAMAQRRARAANVTFLEADAASCSFSPEHDLIFSCFGVMFFVDPVAAFANIRKSAARGGRLAFVCWRAVEENEWASLPWKAAAPFLPMREAPRPDAPGPFAFADRERVRTILTQAGFSDIAFEAFDGLMDLGRSPEKAGLQVTRLMGPTMRALRDADRQTRASVETAVNQALASHLARTGHIRLGMACWLAGARAG